MKINPQAFAIPILTASNDAVRIAIANALGFNDAVRIGIANALGFIFIL